MPFRYHLSDFISWPVLNLRVANRKRAAPQAHPTEKPAGIGAGSSEADIEAARLIVADADRRTSNFPRR
jgi:hypothetical protein